MTSRIPIATYRLQFNKDFRFQDALGILDYLAELGISDLYSSPILMSRRGSGHGYDVTDPTRIDPDLGTEEEFAELQSELQRRGMGIVFDIVPNHMAASHETPWWMDVLENGYESAFASYFDIDWHPKSRSLSGKVLLPVLAHPFGDVLDSGELGLEFDKGKFVLCYLDSRFPIAPRSYPRILKYRFDSLKNYVDPSSNAYQEYSGILAALDSLLDPARQTAMSAADKRVAFGAIHERLRSLAESNAEIARFISDNLREFNGTPQAPESFGSMEQLLSEQHYKLAYWQNANEAINYRRFFTITDLIGIRVEDPVVFEATHGAFFKLVRRESFSGLRIDHIDGLRDPLAYLNRLAERAKEILRESNGTPPYVLVEKILARGEQLPLDWPVAGTTGYEYLNAANRLFVHPDKVQQIRAVYDRFVGETRSFPDVLYENKKLVMSTLLATEVRALSRRLAELAMDDRYARDLSRQGLTEALVEVIARLPVYRTYIRNLDVPPESAAIIENAIAATRERRPDLHPCLLFLRDVLLVLSPAHVQPGQREARLAFVLRWQQFTGSIVAKSMEDTALYVYYPLSSLNEVGGDPRPELPYADADFTDFLAARRERWPASFNTSTTHDTKRSEDVRARINVLSQIPDEWQVALESWAALNLPLKEDLNGEAVPDRNEEYLFYQTLMGVWPLDGDVSCAKLVERLQSYMVKAAREAMVHTRWTRPNAEHEGSLTRFIAALLTSPAAQQFRTDACAFQRRIAYGGMLDGLAQTILKIASPGVPDFYQGADLWDLRLVDPDNRGPIDFTRRMQMLAELREAAQCNSGELPRDLLRDLGEHWEDGRIKLYVIWKALAHRGMHTELFRDGDFASLETRGSGRALAFCRFLEGYRDVCLIAAPRWTAMQPAPNLGSCDKLILREGMPSAWKNVFTDETVHATDRRSADGAGKALELSQVFAQFPVALLSPV